MPSLAALGNLLSMERFLARLPRVSMFLILSRKGLYLHVDDSEQEKPSALTRNPNPGPRGRKSQFCQGPGPGMLAARVKGPQPQWQQEDQVWGLSLHRGPRWLLLHTENYPPCSIKGETEAQRFRRDGANRVEKCHRKWTELSELPFPCSVLAI